MEIRRLTKIYEYEQAVHLQRTIWSMSDLEIQPTDTFAVAEKIGGETLGAFFGTTMVGFCLGLPALKEDGYAFLHSHMLGVLPEHTNKGIGRALKLAQRTSALSRGIRLIEWTFDPLQIKNTFFNTERLGAVARRCYYNLYGQTSNALDAGLPTDRCVAEWWLDSPGVESITNGKRDPKQIAITYVAVPLSFQLLRAWDLFAAREIQTELMTKLSAHFADGLSLVGVELTADFAHYLLGHGPGTNKPDRVLRR